MAPDQTPDPRRLFLFVDWHHVQKGELQPVLDPSRVSEAGRTLIGSLARDFRKTFPEGEHGLRPRNVPYGIRIVPEAAEKSPPWLVADKPWEQRIHTGAVLCEESRYRCWYLADLGAEKREWTVSDGRAMELSGSALAYAESRDGWTWTKPDLDVLSQRGTGRTNLLTPDANGGCVFRDEHAGPEERYKTFHFGELPPDEVPPGAPSRDRYGLYGVCSPDGYRWTKRDTPLIRYFCDTTNIAGWDPLLGRYSGFFRHHVQGGRAISRSETEDFWNWPSPELLLSSAPLDRPADDYYTNGYTCYPDDPSLRLLFVAVYHRDTDLVDVRLALSRDGRVFQWLSYEPIIRSGTTGDWDRGAIYATPSLVHLPDGRLGLPYTGYSASHNEVWYRSLYCHYESSTGIAWALWQDGRLAGFEAGEAGEFSTHAAAFEGDRIQINARTARAGSIQVELRAGGKTIDGHSFADCVPFSGDAVWADCCWKESARLARLGGKRLEMGFRLNNAKIFAVRFV